MSTPNQMPKNNNQIGQRVVGDLINTVPTSWTRKTLSKDDAGKEVVDSISVNHHSLRYPLAQNVSEDNVERAARRWLL